MSSRTCFPNAQAGSDASAHKSSAPRLHNGAISSVYWFVAAEISALPTEVKTQNHVRVCLCTSHLSTVTPRYRKRTGANDHGGLQRGHHRVVEENPERQVVAEHRVSLLGCSERLRCVSFLAQMFGTDTRLIFLVNIFEKNTSPLSVPQFYSPPSSFDSLLPLLSDACCARARLRCRRHCVAHRVRA